MSERGLAAIRDDEAFVAEVYDDGAGNETIGYGHMVQAGESFPQGITQAEAKELFEGDVREIVDPAMDKVTVDLNQNQVDALGSFIFNAGPGSFQRDVLPHLNAGNFDQATAEMAQYVKGRNQRTGERTELRGLVRRRQEEIDLFNTPTSPPRYSFLHACCSGALRRVVAGMYL